MTQSDLAKCRKVAQFWRKFHARNRIWSGAVTAQVIDDLCAEVERLRAATAQVAPLEAVPWGDIRTVIDAAYQFGQEMQHGGIGAACETAEKWVDENQISDESCATIHPEIFSENKGPENPRMFGEVG